MFSDVSYVCNIYVNTILRVIQKKKKITKGIGRHFKI